MNIIILGKGYVGTALFDCLNKTFNEDTDCVNIYSKSELDYTDRSTLVNRITPETWVINTCGYTGRPNVDACEDNKDDTWYYNVCVPMKIMSSCKEAGAHFVHVSSGCIYDGYDKDYTENDQPNRAPYPSTKCPQSAAAVMHTHMKHACICINMSVNAQNKSSTSFQ